MKKLFTLLLALCLAVVPALSMAEESEEMDLVLEGFVTEILDDGFVMDDADMGEIMLNTSDATVWDGFVTAETLEIGQYVTVQYDGRMTRSLPPQAHADRVGCYTLQGIVSEVYEDQSFLLTGDPIHGDVIVHSDAALHPVHAGMIVTVYYDGVMALSLPGQVSARYVDVPQVTGTVSEFSDEGFILTDENGVPYKVIMDENTLVGLMQEAVIEENTAAEEDSEAEVEIAIEEGTPEELTADASLTETIEWGDGDTVTVYYNGMLTRSIPAQLAALEVVVKR